MPLRVHNQADLKQLDGHRQSPNMLMCKSSLYVIYEASKYKTRVSRKFEYTCGHTNKYIGWTKTS